MTLRSPSRLAALLILWDAGFLYIYPMRNTLHTEQASFWGNIDLFSFAVVVLLSDSDRDGNFRVDHGTLVVHGVVVIDLVFSVVCTLGQHLFRTVQNINL